MGKRWKAVILSMILPIIVQLGIYVVWGQFPFGDNSLLIWDMEWQYAPFFAHLHDILRRDASALYSFSRAIGGNMFSVAAYYLISPFNLLFYFFDAEHIYIGILIVTLLKVGVSGMSMYCFLCRKKQCFDAILFSTAYALSAYMVGYQFNLLWLDALIFLPMVARGIEQIIDRGKFVLYTISISFAIITNFYMGYIICFFSVLYFLYYFFSITRRENILKIVTVYGISSVIGGGISAWIALPTWYVLQRGKNDISLSVLKDFHTIFSYTDLFDACFAGTVSTEQITDGRPLIYCGVLTLMMAMCWIVLGKESLRKRVLYLLLLGFIVLSFNYYNLNCLWHAFNYPVGSPYRFSFIYIFLLLDIAHKGYHSLLDQQTHNRTKALIGSGLILIIILIARRNTFVVRGQKDVLYSNIFLIVSYLWLLLFGRKKKVGMYLVTIVLCLELLFNADQLYSSSWQYDSVSVTGYNQYMEDVEIPFQEQTATMKYGGKIRRGDLFQLRFYLKNGERIDQDKIFVYGEVDGILDRYAMSIKKQQVDINMHTDSQLELSCVNKSTNIQYVLCSIPWENGWSVTVDGEKMTEPLEIQDFVAIPIDYGEHMIELRYVPQGFYAGIVISMIALVFLLICWRISLCFKWFYQW